ncbi:hypothetical protein ZIOFF_032391 [Zingiber officinale]|uniref:RING-type E3 ubiquitin transferase n=1 Tax=Zingiber officinale TaxID=94328 RepID=A0A8J5LBJ8_ZINOF|nr:hypothetical protein ZIOFF_032391 [Zingiber officinale]
MRASPALVSGHHLFLYLFFPLLLATPALAFLFLSSPCFLSTAKKKGRRRHHLLPRTLLAGATPASGCPLLFFSFQTMPPLPLSISSLANRPCQAEREYFTDRRKIGEGVYGPVYKCHLDHTAVAVKVLRPDAAQGRSQFHQEIEVLSCIRHPHMVLLLGAYPEYGCIVYEYMANGSLEDRLFRRGNTPTVPWKYCFRIAAEIATPLLFLHHMKPEPLVHRDLKPANILLDRNYVCKIGDVALAYLVPPSVTDSVMQYRVTSTAGTFCYIDPEYQQTGMLGVQSDIYSLGVMLLQIIITKPPMGLTHHVSRTIEHGELESMLDPEVADWPVHEAQRYTEIALKCAELRQKDWPDMEKAILPELNRLRAPGDCNFVFYLIRTPTDGSPGCQVSHQVNHFIAP